MLTWDRAVNSALTEVPRGVAGQVDMVGIVPVEDLRWRPALSREPVPGKPEYGLKVEVLGGASGVAGIDDR